MTKAKNGFGLKPETEEEKEARYYDLTVQEWVWLFDIMYVCVRNGAAPMLYTSREGNALCISIKHGKSEKKYWIGPDDNPGVKLSEIVSDWNMHNAESIMDQFAAKEYEKGRAEHDAGS